MFLNCKKKIVYQLSRCWGHGNAFDNGAGTPISRIFLPFLCVGCVGLVLWSSRDRLRKQERGDGDADKIERADRADWADRADGADRADRADRADDEDSRDQKPGKEWRNAKQATFPRGFCADLCCHLCHRRTFWQGSPGERQVEDVYVNQCRVSTNWKGSKRKGRHVYDILWIMMYHKLLFLKDCRSKYSDLLSKWWRTEIWRGTGPRERRRGTVRGSIVLALVILLPSRFYAVLQQSFVLVWDVIQYRVISCDCFFNLPYYPYL